MSTPVNIQYLPHQQVDLAKWDRCIDEAHNGLVYAYSIYLDKMATNWAALILGDYEACMPLTWNKKYGIYYLYQPFLTAQLGVFGKNVSNDIVEAFLRAIPNKFRYWDFYLNAGNVFPLKQFELYQRNNFVLSLRHQYDELSANYRENLRRNIRKAIKLGCKVEKDFAVAKVIELALAQMPDSHKQSSDHAQRFASLYQELYKRKMATTYGISLNGELLASCVFFFSHRRAYYILVGNHPNGKTIGASHALIDAFIRDHAGEDMLLDFEGSDIQNLAFFYSSYGAIEEKFAGIRVNRLPWLVRLLKK